MLAPIVLVVTAAAAAAAARAPHNPSKCLEDNGRGLLPDADCIDCSATPRVGCADNFTLSIERHPTVATCHVTRCYGPPAASAGTVTTAEAPPAKPLTTTTAPAPEHPTTTAEPTTTTTATEAKSAWDPSHCMLGPPATCWADTAFQRCPIDRQGAYGAVMAKRGDTQAMHAVYLQLTTTGIGCTKPQTKPQTNLDRCLATCAGTTNHGKSYSCNQQLSCDMACKMKYEEGLTTSECNAKCDRTGSSGCRLTVGAATFSMCSSCHRGSAHAAGASIPTQCRSGCAFPALSSSGSSGSSSASSSASSSVSSSASSSPSTDAPLAPPCTAEQAGEQQRKALSALQTTADAIVASTKKIVVDLKTVAVDTAEAEAELRRLEAALGAKNC